MSYNIRDLKQQFLEYIEIERGRSVKTVRNYDFFLSKFLNFSKIKMPEDITTDKVREFRLWLNRQPGFKSPTGIQTLKKNTQNYHLIALRLFLKYLGKRQIKSLPPDMIELAKVGQRQIDVITAEELKRLLNAPDGDDLASLRDRAMLETLFSTGLRVAELCSLSRDIDFNADEFSVRGKGDKVRVVFLSLEAKKALKKYLEKRTDMGEALFVEISERVKKANPKNKKSDLDVGDTPLTTRSVERIVKKYAIKAGISKKVTPHTIRHCYATDLLGSGADIRSVQMLLGHANINTTQIYTHLTDTQLKKVHQQFHGKRR
ncbi:MAG: hypothetical protein A3C79_03035 [Candidatus Taylorbacteria bacterium RIFCSPHIGHO2_02_FULL_45_28]|uniref:Tyrosine recombinase XerC n=1 Tax=Candidatus Taylorbacteria bacterium RIFCSPHIGHO2_12_FULL_45_16 TaxID=1802315 RepID=A0A1G2N148_9BACT|nr:MAG: hypothetical protein A2830_00755 [Candidatus Taylorbacteria bacterium RIFCSPHIGHO2_01_FULL_44_110]OHA24935.1 MAG: hypothetical protein A3C79_03035 [Candidatus Taylorbacteria bacterium RIFCSPHIGHO2_02_FULL_45_28]OHA29753.1 MAG: hypothetical protein A3F51_03450 [Candidatus Taylorbacteria bacterium RIFCSPHIGHO2_12_FULL_45_16]OHA32697.1 MAG: hypothetical protein A3A23_00320 [Candidatus Taylorbacteria bacterium RIFCSPLOWO2_01_FULL_45_59]OHA39281.1 MAG: hypothetical protein A3I98_01390 [Candi